ncbi:phosphatase PAP2 family protein [Streptomyces europaeiscabiei]|uniref:phosphatase PAP2 family protein n=1 Tax=Streptomyces europaeiscabiei TaxID=146819 RepID=UPI002E17FE9C
MTAALLVTADAGSDFGGDLYRDITEFAADTPSWFQHLAELGTEGGILILLALFLGAWWRARRGSDRVMTLALLAPVATGVAYFLSEILKTWVQEERPCRAVPGASPIAECPEPGDWSFPSNHSAIAAGAAFTLFLVWRTAFWFALPVAVLTALSRSFLGVHYFHDVVAGFAWGAAVSPLVLMVLTRPGLMVVSRLRMQPALKPLLIANVARHR